jgi:hypothetical protein
MTKKGICLPYYKCPLQVYFCIVLLPVFNLCRMSFIVMHYLIQRIILFHINSFIKKQEAKPKFNQSKMNKIIVNFIKVLNDNKAF